MAKKLAKKTTQRKTQTAGNPTRATDSTEAPQDYKSMLKNLAANPAVKYVAGGIATAVLAKVASGLTRKYPEISRFISDSLDNVEGKLGDFRNGLNNDTSANPH
jgi:hypothetical protein